MRAHALDGPLVVGAGKGLNLRMLTFCVVVAPAMFGVVVLLVFAFLFSFFCASVGIFCGNLILAT